MAAKTIQKETSIMEARTILEKCRAVLGRNAVRRGILIDPRTRVMNIDHLLSDMLQRIRKLEKKVKKLEGE